MAAAGQTKVSARGITGDRGEVVEELHGAKSYLWVALVGAEMVGKGVLDVGQGPAVVASCGGGTLAS